MNNPLNAIRFTIILIAVFVYAVIEFVPNLVKSVTIDNFDAVITIDDQGDMTVTERWDMNYHQAMRVRFRDIVYVKYAENYPLIYDDENRAMIDSDSINVQFYAGVHNRTSLIRVGLKSNGDYDELYQPIRCEPNLLECESIFVDTYSAGGLTGDVSFIYTYTIEGVITKYSDISELNWRLFEYAEGTIKASTITIHLPDNAYDIDRFYAWGHGLSTGNIDIVDSTTIVVTAKNIKNGEFPELRVLMPNLLFPNIREQNIVIHPDMDFDRIYTYENELATETNRRIFIAQLMFYGAFLLIPLMGFVTYRVYLKHDKEYEPEFQGDFYRELPDEATPAEVSYLYYIKQINDEVFTATLLDLIRRGYIGLVDEIKNFIEPEADFTLIRKKVSQEHELLSHEKIFMEMIFEMIGNRTEVSTKKIEKFASTYTNAKSFESKAKEFIKEARKQAEKQHYFESLTQEKADIRKFVWVPILYFGLSLILWMTSAIDTLFAMGISLLISVAYLIYIAKFQRRSKTGNELYVKWKAFRNFLENFSSMEDYPIPSIIVWEHYLVYATVFNLADRVVEQLSVKLPKEAFESGQSTYLGYGYRRSLRHYNYHIYRTFSRSYGQAKSYAAQTIARHNQAQASSGRGGGFGGGSSFGGGGGGGRSR